MYKKYLISNYYIAATIQSCSLIISISMHDIDTKNNHMLNSMHRSYIKYKKYTLNKPLCDNKTQIFAKKNAKTTATSIPMWSPTIVLTGPDVA